MSCISGSYNPAVGPLLQVIILSQDQSGAGEGAQIISGANLPLFLALADTGASSTCVSSKVVESCGLQPSGKTTLSGATGQSVVNQFTFIVGFVFNPIQDPSGRFSGTINQHLVQGCQFTDHGMSFDVLLGRDILCKGSFSLSFDGHFIFSL